MALLERLHAKNYAKIRSDVIDPVLHGDEKVVAFGLAQWFPKSKLAKLIDDNVVMLTVGKQYIVCLTDERFLLFEVPKKLTTSASYSSTKLTRDMPRTQVRIKSLGKKEFITRARAVTLMLGPTDETTLKFNPPYTRDIEAICAELPHA